MAMPCISRQEMAELFGEASSDDEPEQPYEYLSQVGGAKQELWLVDKQPGSEDDDHRTVDTLAAELGWAMREQAEQQSEYSLELEYMKRDLEVQRQTADKALRQLRHQKREMASEMGKVQAELQAQQTQTAGLQHALHQEQSRCAWQQGCITHLTHQLASLQAELIQLKDAQASHVEQALLQTQSVAKREHLKRVSDYQATELMKLQREIYQLRSLMAAHGLDPALASEVPALSPWSMATTPEHLWDTSSTSMTPPSGSTQGLSSIQRLSPAAPSQGLSHTAAFMPTSSAQELEVASAGLPASSSQAGAAAGRHYASTQHSRNLSGSPMAGLGRTGPQVRTTKKQQARQNAVAATLSRSTSASAATAQGTSSTLASAHHSAGAPAVKRRPDSMAGSAARPSPAAGKHSIRAMRGPLAGGTPVLSTGRRPSLCGSKSCMMATSNCHSNRHSTSKENSRCSANKENSQGSGKITTPATSSLQVIQQQPLASRALLQRTPCDSPTACKSPSAAMADGDETPSSPGFSPHALQLRAIPVPFWGVPAAVPLAAAHSCATAAGNSGTLPSTATAATAVIKQPTTATTAAGTFATAAAAASASTAAAPATATASLVTTATATTAVGGVFMALLADRDPTASKSCMVATSVHSNKDTTSKENSCSKSDKATSSGTGKCNTSATTSLWASQQQRLASRALLQRNPCSPTACNSPLAAMADGDETPSSPGFSPHVLQLQAITVPFWGVPAAVPLEAANSCATAAGTLGTAMPAATAPASAAAPSVPAALAATATATTSALPDQTSIARTLHFTDAEQAAASAASVEPSRACLVKRHAERQHNPLLSCDITDAASTPFQPSASSAATSSQHIIPDNHAAHSPPGQAMVADSDGMPMATDVGDTSAPFSAPFLSHALQVRVTDVPIRGLPAASRLAAANNGTTAAGIAGAATTAATAPTSAPAPPAMATACVAAPPATRATTTSTGAGSTTAVVLPNKDPVAKALHLTDAEQAAAPAATVEPSQAHGLNAHAEERHHAHSGIADISGAVVAKENQPRGTRRRTAAPAASRIVTRSQAAAQKHVQRMRLRTQRKC